MRTYFTHSTKWAIALIATVGLMANTASAVSPYDTSYGIQWNYLNGGVEDERSMSIAASPDGTAWGVTGHRSYTGANISIWGDQGNGGSWDSGYGQWNGSGKLVQGQSLPNITGHIGENQSYTRNHVEMRGTDVVLGWDGRPTAGWDAGAGAVDPIGGAGDLMNVQIAPDGTESYYRTTAFQPGANHRNQAGVPSQTSDAYWFAGGYQGVGVDIVIPNDSAVGVTGSSSYSAYAGRRNADGTMTGPAKQTEIGGRGHYLDMAVNEASNIAVATGYVSPAAANFIDMDGDGTAEYTPSTTNTNGYIGIYDATTMALTGHIGWISAANTQQPTDVAATPDGGFIVVGVVTDARNGFVNPAPGTADTVIEKYNSAGVLQWAWQSEDVDNATVGSVEVDSDGNIYIGERVDTIRSNDGGTTLSTNSNWPLWTGTARITKFDSAGNEVWETDIAEAGTISALDDIGVADKKWVYGISETNPVVGSTWSNANGYVPSGDDRELLIQKLIPGDFDSNGSVNADDIDLAFAGYGFGNSPAVDTWDFNEDGFSNLSDVVFWVQDIMATDQGDNDLDGDIDTSDITTSVINFTGAGGSGKGWADGDTNGDGDVDTSDVTTSVVNFTGALAGAPGVPDLWYDPATGNITIDTDGLGDLGALDLQSAGGLFTGDPTDFSGLPAGATDDLDGQIGWVQPFAAGVSGVFDLGNVMQAGLTEAQFLADLAGSQYGIALGAGGGGGQIELFYGPYTAIPEPSSMVLLGLAGCMAVVGLRRRAA